MSAAGTATMRKASAECVESDQSIDELQTHDLGELRVRWRRIMRAQPPVHLSRALMARVLTYKLEVKLHGDLDPASIRFLNKILDDHDAARRTGKLRPKAVPIVPSVPAPPLRPGTVLIREHQGQMHSVMVMVDGFAWSGQTYASLSEVARAITGTRWNGPRFFGLRDQPERALQPPASGGGSE